MRLARQIQLSELELRLGVGILCWTRLSKPIELAPPSITLNTREPSRTEMAKKHFAKRDSRIDKMHKGIARQLHYARHETLRNLEEASYTRVATANAEGGGGVGLDVIFDLFRFRNGFFQVIRNQSAQALHDSGNELFSEIGLDDPWHMPDPIALDFLARRQNLLSNVPLEIWEQIRQEIIAGVEKGESIAQIAKRITTTFDAIEEGRAVTISSTETSAAYGFGRDQAMRVSGVRYKRWVTSGLENVRPAHEQAARINTKVPIDEPFLVGGEHLMYPGDPSGSAENVINCRCIVVAVDPELEEMARRRREREAV